jgi:hypothetical protein
VYPVPRAHWKLRSLVHYLGYAREVASAFPMEVVTNFVFLFQDLINHFSLVEILEFRREYLFQSVMKSHGFRLVSRGFGLPDAFFIRNLFVSAGMAFVPMYMVFLAGTLMISDADCAPVVPGFAFAASSTPFKESDDYERD